jgi:hypothetical protein
VAGRLPCCGFNLGTGMRFLSGLLKATLGVATALVLQACGGGGDSAPANFAGGSGAPTGIVDTGCYATSTAAPITPVSPIIVGTGTVVVTGTALFAFVPNGPTGGLNYAGATDKPVRGATVQALSGGIVLASTITSAQGAYSLNVPANTTFSIRLRPELINAAGPASWSVAVLDNTVAGTPPQVVDTAAVSSGPGPAIQKSITAGSGWGSTSYVAPRAAAPFAILDTIYASMQLVTSVKPNAQFPPLTVFWSPNNQPALPFDLVRGDVGGTSFNTTGNCADLNRSMVVLGKDGVDTDEYDSSVVAHEYGHYLQSAFSTSHSLGGSHSFKDKLDMTLAFSEGWGNAFSSMARTNPIYADSSNAAQSGGFTLDLAAPPTDARRGWYREDSVDTSLYALFLGQGFTPIWTALTGPMKTSQDALATIFSFADALRSAGNSALNSILAAQNILVGATPNQWGQGETNNGGDAGNLPIYTPLTLGVEATACFIGTNVRTYPAGDTPVNKLGAVKYFRATLPSAGVRTITSVFPQGGHDIDFEVFQKGVLRGEAGSDSPVSEVGSINLAAGEVVIRVSDFNAASVAPSAPCATIRID